MFQANVPQWARLISVPVWVSGSDRRIIWLNSYTEQLIGKSASECVGRCCYEIIAARDPGGQRFCHADCEIQRRASQGLPIPLHNVWIDGAERREVYLLTIPVRLTTEGPLMIVHCAIEEGDVAGTVGDGLKRAIAHPLTPREREVLDCLISGAELRQIALELNISYSTLRNHVQHILNKLDVHSIREAIVRALGPPLS